MTERARFDVESWLKDWIGAICALVSVGSVVSVVSVGALGLGMPCNANAQAISIEEAESLVRQVYFEGMPQEAAARIGPEGAARLIEMLGDPTESRAHAQILLALGLCGDPNALDAIRDWADQPRDGEIDRATFKAWQALPFALGHLARHDARALSELEASMNAEPPAWRFRHHRGARLHRLARRSAATSLALTGLPAAGHALDRAGGSTSDADFETHLRDARLLHRERARARGQEGAR